MVVSFVLLHCRIYLTLHSSILSIQYSLIRSYVIIADLFHLIVCDLVEYRAILYHLTLSLYIDPILTDPITYYLILSCLISSYLTVPDHVLRHIIYYVTMSYHASCHRVVSYLDWFCLSCRASVVLRYLIWSSLTLSYLILYYLTLPYPISSYPILSYHVVSYHHLACLIFSDLVSSYCIFSYPIIFDEHRPYLPHLCHLT